MCVLCAGPTNVVVPPPINRAKVYQLDIHLDCGVSKLDVKDKEGTENGFVAGRWWGGWTATGWLLPIPI